jgi:predicted nucleotidyltransferase
MKALCDLATLTPHDREILGRVSAIIHDMLPTARVLLYGSVARGTHRPDSDYDVAVITPEPLPSSLRDKIWDAMFDAEMVFQVPLSVIFYSIAEWESPLRQVTPFYQEIERDAVLI